MSGIRTALISGHVWNNGKQMASERTKSVNIYNQCPLDKFIIQQFLQINTEREKEIGMMNLEGRKKQTQIRSTSLKP